MTEQDFIQWVSKNKVSVLSGMTRKEQDEFIKYFDAFKERHEQPTVGDKLVQIVENFRDDNGITCEETVYQSDRVIVNAYDFVAELIDVVGYIQDEDEDEDE